MPLFSRNYEKAGAGIAKNAPKKKGFFRYWEIFGRKFWKLIGLNFFYFLFFVPLIAGVFFLYEALVQGSTALGIVTALCFILFVVLFGPATAGHTKILKNYFMEKPTFMVRDFMKTFRTDFKYSAIVGIIDCIIALSIGSSFYVYPRLIDQSGSKVYYVFFAITISIGLIAILMNFYAFLMIVSTRLSLKNVLKNSLALGIVALKKNAFVLLVWAAIVAIYIIVIFYVPMQYAMILLFLLPIMPMSWMGLDCVVVCYPVIQKYIINPYYEERGEQNPEMPEMPKEDGEDDDVVFEDMGGKEKPINPTPKAKTRGGKGDSGAKGHKGKVIS